MRIRRGAILYDTNRALPVRPQLSGPATGSHATTFLARQPVAGLRRIPVTELAVEVEHRCLPGRQFLLENELVVAIAQPEGRRREIGDAMARTEPQPPAPTRRRWP